MEMCVQTRNPAETRELGAVLGRMLQAGDIIAVKGDLGAGKTTFAQGVGQGLGVKGRVTSPTFTLINEYRGRLPLYHFDTYRLESAGEMDLLGYDEYFEGDGVTLIEWADRVVDILPQERLDIAVERVGDAERVFHFRPHGGHYEAMVGELKGFVRSRF